MSDESDETRRVSSGDAARPDKEPPELDATQVDGTPVNENGDEEDAEDVPAEATAGRAVVPPPDEKDTLPGKGSKDDDTLDDVRTVPTIRDEPTVVTEKPGPGSTSVMPAVDDDWAPSRANPAWSGRAEVRTPQPGRGYPEVDWAASAPPQQRDRWWMPIVVGIIALILLGVLGWAVYLIVQNSSGNETPTPATSSAAAPAETVTTTTTSPSATPTTTSPEPMPSTTEPTSSELTIPALRGLSQAEAQAALRSTGLNYRLIFRSAPDVPPGTVIDSDPVEGQEVPPDTTVTLVVAAEPTNTPTTTEPTQDPGAGGGN